MVAIPDLRRAAKGIQNNEVLTPLFHASLNDPDFSGFTVQIEPWTPKPPDGYFHPSAHGTWTARQMALYLMAPRKAEVEKMQVTSVLAITQGHFWHTFAQHIFGALGIMLQDEVPLIDEEHKRKGHMDGLLQNREGLEIKTINSRTIRKITCEADLKEKKPEYWAQAQEYLDMADLPVMRFFFLSPDYPFPTSEFLVRRDLAHQAQRRLAYRKAISYAASHTWSPDLEILLPACCTVGSSMAKTCPVKSACPIGRQS